jgi:beta-phosphoglucomutase-like phosphatase (HAD superfamily)
MNKLIIFDLDGVLIDSKEIHFNALNLALNEFDSNFIISRDEQDSTFEGLTTRSKLDILTKTKNLPEELHQYIWKLKQAYSAALFTSVSTDHELINLFKFIRSSDIKIAVASNSIRETLDNCLRSLGLLDLIDYSLSNEDVIFPKPNPEIYNKVMEYFKATPRTTVIFEDSPIGLTAAYESGAMVEPVRNRSDIWFDRILRVIEELNEA